MKHIYNSCMPRLVVARLLFMLAALAPFLPLLTGCTSKSSRQFPNIYIPDPEKCFFSSISRDNKFVAIECIQVETSPDGFAKRNLLIRDTSKTDWSPLFTENDLPLHAIFSVFSPDSTMLAVTDTDGSLWIFETSNWNVLQIFNYSWIQGRLSWSPDSKTIAVEGRGDIALTLLTIEGDYRHLLRYGDIFPKKERSGSSELDAWQITWSPNGKRIAYIVYETSQGEIVENQLWTIELLSTKREMLTRSRPNDNRSNFVLTNLNWSPDGKIIALKGHSIVQVYDIQSKELRTVFEVKGSSFTHYIPLVSKVLWSPDSSRIAFYVFSSTSDGSNLDSEEGIYIINLANWDLSIKPERKIGLIQWEDENALIVENYMDDTRSFIGILSIQ